MLGSTDRVWALSAAWLAGEFLIQSVLLTSFMMWNGPLLHRPNRRLAQPFSSHTVRGPAFIALIYTQPLFRLDLLPGMPLLNALLSVVWIGAMSNAFNFLDNMDGLSAGIGAICLVFLVSQLCWLENRASLWSASCALVPAADSYSTICPRQYLYGRCGQLFIGYTISAIAQYLSQNYSKCRFNLHSAGLLSYS